MLMLLPDGGTIKFLKLVSMVKITYLFKTDDLLGFCNRAFFTDQSDRSYIICKMLTLMQKQRIINLVHEQVQELSPPTLLHSMVTDLNLS